MPTLLDTATRSSINGLWMLSAARQRAGATQQLQSCEACVRNAPKQKQQRD
ncbi:MAG: hypothetical protein WCK86_16255 [Planctomycetia bacterium]